MLQEQRKTLIDLGQLPTRNLAECLAVDQAALAHALAGQLPEALLEQLTASAELAQALGLSKKVAAIGLALGQWLEQAAAPWRQQAFERCCTHPSDTVRSWAAFAQAHLSRSLPLEEALQAQLRFARDEHFGVREWAWIALRPRLAQNLDAALLLLGRHVGDADPLVRRFCIEILRLAGSGANTLPHSSNSRRWPSRCWCHCWPNPRNMPRTRSPTGSTMPARPALIGCYGCFNNTLPPARPRGGYRPGPAEA